ncbi:helix-turn-helix domain-containing protein [Nocardia sp. XZ_19_385]|uniref:helix-turn-helix domain-containing protein n=1 Tax=Nocardia sp. XZ_19_385 TaxID=2769488 RepID=UPI001E5A6584|nr:helix-turn-helix domain-containing protein [Nocardia sp. XZ_19_385]
MSSIVPSSALGPEGICRLAKPDSYQGLRSHCVAERIWLSTVEVAARLKVPPKTLAAWASTGHGPKYARIGRFRRYRLSDLVGWEQEQVDRTSPPHARRACCCAHEQWLSTDEVSMRLKIPKKTLAAWAGRSRGPRFARMGRHRRYREADLEAWERQRLADT